VVLQIWWSQPLDTQYADVNDGGFRDLDQPVGAWALQALQVRRALMLTYSSRLCADMCHLSFLSRAFRDDLMTIELSVSFERRRYSFVVPSLIVLSF
jgi:hypothetical protein